MNASEFATLCKRESDALLAEYLKSDGTTFVSTKLHAAALNPEQREHVTDALDQALTDAFYTMLMALDGAASLGGDVLPKSG